jgi:RNA polymerase sigma-70 factor (ECF subfamily)
MNLVLENLTMTSEDKQILFLELFEPCRESLVRFVKAMTRNNDYSKDLVQETILRAYDKFDKLKEYNAFQSYLFSIASNIYKRYKWRRRFFWDTDSSDESDNIFENIHSRETETDSNYDIEILWKALSKLPEKQREAIVLFDIIGLGIEEIREIQGGSPSGIKSRIQRGKQELSEMLTQKNFDILSFKKEPKTKYADLPIENEFSSNRLAYYESLLSEVRK